MLPPQPFFQVPVDRHKDFINNIDFLSYDTEIHNLQVIKLRAALELSSVLYTPH